MGVILPASMILTRSNGVVDAQADSSPLVAISAQVGLNRIYKESHQIVDLVSMYRPVTKWAGTLLSPVARPEIIRKAFDVAQTERRGAVFVAIPEDVEGAVVTPDAKPLTARPHHSAGPDPLQVAAAVDLIRNAKRPIILAGHGAARAGAGAAVTRLSEILAVPVATTFMGKGVISDRHRNALGVVGFMRHDYVNFAFDKSDLILAIGYELQEFAPARINPNAESFGAKGHQIKAAAHLLPTLRTALAEDGVSIIACPVDYSENIKLTDKLASLRDGLGIESAAGNERDRREHGAEHAQTKSEWRGRAIGS
jgi:acetolactate synthase I/II/III large subunit